MAKLIQIPYDNNIIIPVMTAQSVQRNYNNAISLDALGLLVNLLSYPPTWELHKTELYKRFAKNKRTSVKSAWDDLVNSGYIIEFKYRSGKKYEYVYYFRKFPFTDQEKSYIIEKAISEYGEISTLDFQQSKMNSPNHADNKSLLRNKDPLENNNKYKEGSNIPDDLFYNWLEK